MFYQVQDLLQDYNDKNGTTRNKRYEQLLGIIDREQTELAERLASAPATILPETYREMAWLLEIRRDFERWEANRAAGRHWIDNSDQVG
jgi:hypothetical protein